MSGSMPNGKVRASVDVSGYERERGGQPERVRDYTRGQLVNAGTPPSFAALHRTPDRLGAPGEGGTRSLWAYYFEMAPSYGIFDAEDRQEFADRMVQTASGEIGQSKRSIRSWVRAAQDALRSEDQYRIAETARNVFADIPGEVADVPELRSIYEHLGQANIAAQHIENALGLGDDRAYQEHRREFESIVAMIDSETKDWDAPSSM